MVEKLTLERLVANIEQSHGHIAKQEQIIERLTRQGHVEMAEQAKSVLKVMNGHLTTEIDMLDRMEAQAAKENPAG